MKRFANGLFGAAVGLAVALAGCGTAKDNPPAGGDAAVVTGKADMAMSGAMPDLLKSGPCLNGAPGCTGDPCTKDADCAKGNKGQAAKCVKSITPMGGTAVTWDSGYCQTACTPSKNDANNNYLDTNDCPSADDSATCVGSGGSGVCMKVCGAVTDCRDKYVCANVAGGGNPNAVCYPIGASECDPAGDPRPANVMCKNNQVCVSYSVDESFGGCADICDPIAQGCAPDANGNQLACVVDLKGKDGKGTCIGSSGASEGDACVYLNDCAPGLQCYNKVCRQYCRTGQTADAGTTDGGVAGACPAKQNCIDIKISGVQFKANVTGICSP